MDESRGPEAGDGEDEMNDAVLIRYLDGELTEGAAAALEARILAAPEARERLEALRRRSAGLTALLAEVAPSEAEVRSSYEAMRPALTRAPADGGRVRPRRSSTARWAAAAALLLGVTLAVPPLRAWMVERAMGLLERVGVAPPASSEAGGTGEPAAGGPAAASVAFEVAGEVLAIEVLHPGGRLLVSSRAGAAGGAELRGAREVVVLPGVLTVEDRASPATTYQLVVPASVRTLRLRVGEGPAREHVVPAEGGELVIELGGG